MTAQAKALAFQHEKDLEDYLKIHLSALLTPLGLDLLVIRTQVATVGHGPFDLLAIDAAGVLYIIELKLRLARPEIVAQVLAYRRGIKRLNRQEVIRLVADGDPGLDLVDAFPRHFGHPLPEATNESQVVIIIAASICRWTAHSILELREEPGYPIHAFRYFVQADTFSLIPCCRDDQDMEALLAETAPLARRLAWTGPAWPRSSGYRVPISDSVRRFWQSHAQHFTSSIVLFSFVLELYVRWAEEVEGDPLDNFNFGLFARQLAALIAESDEWTRVFILPGNEVDAHGMLIGTPSTRRGRWDGHRIVAYLSNPVRRAPDV